MSAVGWKPQVFLANGSLRRAGIRERIEAVAQAGFEGVGLHVRQYERIRAEGWTDSALRTLLRDNGIGMVEIETVVGWDEPPESRTIDAVEREELAFALADAVGARHVMAVGSLDGELRPTARECFAALCDRAARHGLLVALEPQACSSIADLATAVAIVNEVAHPSGGLNVDVWHQTRGGWPLADLVALRPEQIVVIQLNDGPSRPVKPDYLEDTLGYRRPPGEGDFDLSAFLTAATASGTAAPVSVEVLSHALDQRSPSEVAELLARSTRRAIAAARPTAEVG